MTISLYTHALIRARNGEAQLLLAWSAQPTPALVDQLFAATRMALGRDPLVIDLSRASASEARHAFIRAVCMGSSVIATHLDTLDGEALEAALMGLASVNQWNRQAFGVGLSNAPISLGERRFKAIHQHVAPDLERGPRL